MRLKILLIGLLAVCSAATTAAHADQHATHASAHAQHEHHSRHETHGTPTPATGDDANQPPEHVVVQGCWIRALPSHLPSAGYFRLRNESDQAISLRGVQSEAFGHAMLHANREEGGMTKMVHAEAIEVPAGGEFAFTTSNGFHIMLEQPAHALEVGATETLLFQFDRGGPLPVACVVKPPAALE